MSTDKTNAPPPSDTKAENPPPDKPSDKKSPKKGAKSVKAPKSSSNKAFAIEDSDKDGWKPNRLSPAEIGSKVDEAIRNLVKVSGETILYVDKGGSEGGHGALRSYVRVRDRNAYNIEYVSPNDPATVNQLIADGQRAMRYQAGKWSPVIQNHRRAGVAEWIENFPRETFGSLVENRAVWTSVLSALSKGEGGFHTKSQERMVLRGGNHVPYWRVVAHRNGPSPADIEAIFEAKRALPVTIRVNTKNAKGEETKLQWQAGFNFHKPLDDKYFQVPVKGN